MKYTKHINTTQTPQSQPILGSNQVQNSAGGFSFEVDVWTKLDRFLILGTEGGSYYASERKLTQDSAQSVIEAIKKDGVRVVNRVVEISDSGRAPKNDPAVFVLAMAAKLGDDATRKAAREALPKVCRIGTHLFQFAENIEAFGGWGRGTRNAVAKWYNDKPADKLSYQAVKYQQRNGWSHRDLLRLAHPQAQDELHNELYKWIVKGGDEVSAGLPMVNAFERAKRSTETKEIIGLVREYKLPREAIPTQFLTDPAVWEALLEDMPYTALIRNLATMTRIDLLKPLSKATSEVVKRLSDGAALQKARVHPIQVLAALMTYKAGHGMRGKHTWKPISTIIDALDAAFYDSFKNVTPTGKRIMLALDVSGSMSGGEVAGVPGLSPRIASAAMAMVIARTEKDHMFVGFSSGHRGEWLYGAGNSQHYGYRAAISEIDISPRMRMDSVIKEIEKIPMGGTDCALPMLYAKEKKLDVDSFIVLTDSETWAGSVHPSQALKQYRKARGVQSTSVVVGMVANDFTIADPNDGGMLDVVGFDTAAPQLIADFIR